MRVMQEIGQMLTISICCSRNTATMEKRSKILIYDDAGCACTFDLVRILGNYFGPKGVMVKRTTADDIVKNNALNEQVLALFIPGGAATPYMNKLRVLGNEKIRNYVENGGIYFGICAGAYYASRKVSFEQDVPDLAIEQSCGLDLIDAHAVGTLKNDFGLDPYYRPTVGNAAVTTIRWLEDGEEHGVFYHGGPKFEQVKGAEVLAVYAEAEGNPPAIVARQYGKGMAIVSGVHFEDDAISLKSMMRCHAKFLEKAQMNLAKMSSYELDRQRLTDKLMQKLLKHR